MTAGTEVICNDLVRKVEIEEKCVVNGGLNSCDLDEVGNGCVGGDGKDDADDSSYVFVSGGIEVSAGGDPDDTGGINVVDFGPRSDSAEVERLKKEEFGSESEVICDSDQDVNGQFDKISGEEEGVVKNTEEVDDANEVLNVETKLDDIGSRVTFDLKSSLNNIESSLVTVTRSDSVIHPSDVTITQSLSMPVVINTSDSNTDCEVMVNNGSESTNNVIDKAYGSKLSASPTEEQEGQVTVDESGKPSEDLECQVTDDGSKLSVGPTEEREGQVPVESGKPSEDLECQVIADGSESCVSPTEEREGQVTVDESSKPSEDLECQVTDDGSKLSVSPTEEREGQVTVDESVKPSEDLASQVTAGKPLNEPESFGSPTKERECEVSVDGSDSIGSLVDNQEFSASVESELSGNHTEEVNGKSEEHQELLVITSEVNVEAEPTYVCDGIKAEPLSVSEDKKAEGTDIGLSIEPNENPDSGIVLSEDTDVLASGQAEKFDGILETGETQISGTEADKSELLMLNVKLENSEEKIEKQMEGSSEIVSKVTKSVEIEANSEDMKEHVKIEDGIRESQIVVTDSVKDDLNLEDNTTESASEAAVPLETEGNIEPIIHVNTASEYEVSNSIDEPQVVVTDSVEDDLKLEDNTTESANGASVLLETESKIEPIIHVNTTSQSEVSNSIDEPQEGLQPDGSSEMVETVDLVVSECNNSELLVVKGNDSLSTPDELIVVEQKAEIVSDDDEKETEVKDAPVEHVSHLVTQNIAAEDIDCETEVENVDVSDDEEKGTEVNDAPIESVPHLVTDNTSAEGMDCETRVENIDEEKETEVKDAPVGGHSTLSFSDTIVNSGAVIEFGSIGHHETTRNIQNVETEDIDGIQRDEIPTSSVENSVIDTNGAIDVQNEEAEVFPYNFLIKIPRFENENYRDQIRSAQLVVEEKTRLRDAIRVEINGIRAKLKAHNDAYNAAKTEDTAARRLVRLKRQEIDSVQVVINRLKNAMSVEDIDGRIFNLERMIQHETLLLKDEKQFIREIKQLKTLRDQLASNMGSPEEIKQAIDQKDHNEERMKTLRKELDSLKDKASKAEAAVKTVRKTYNDESRKERELQAQFRDADDVRQKAYAHLNSLKKQSYDKNKNFRQFKEDLTAARDFASHRNKDAHHRLCSNQVETFMEQWNNNDEFRKEYINRCNMNASRRQRALEGGPLVPDDVAPVNVNEKADNTPVVLPVEEVKIVSSTEKQTDNNSNSNSNNRSVKNVSVQKNQTSKTKSVAKTTALGSDDVAVVAELAVDGKKEEENTPTKEEIELAKKAEELRKEEIAAKLKEQRRLEEKAKAVEALERKKRNAEKAQIRAEMRARKEAEQKEKEREKRLRKKEKKRTDDGDGSLKVEEPIASLESASEAATVTKETGTETVSKGKNNNKRKAQPPPHFFSKQLKPKPIPPPLVNRNRKRWQQWGKWALAVAAILVLFLLGNTSYFRLKFNGLI